MDSFSLDGVDDGQSKVRRSSLRWGKTRVARRAGRGPSGIGCCRCCP